MSLFLGAGSSVSAGGPTGGQLKQSLDNYFHLKENLQFFDSTESLIGRNNQRRGEVEEFIRRALQSIGLTSDHEYLFSLPWRTVLTTNYDCLPNTISKTLDNSRYVKTVLKPEDDINTQRPDLLFCFKLFGDSSIRYPAPGSMVLTHTDYRQAYPLLAKFYKLFYDLCTTGYIVYIGYSFDDELVFDILTDLQREVRTYPWKGFAITPNHPSSNVTERLREYNIEWVEGTLEQFMQECKKVHSKCPVSSILKINPMKIHGIEVSLEREIETNIIQKYRYLNESDFESVYGAIDFVTGKDKSFKPYTMGWDFPRTFSTTYKPIHQDEITTAQEFVRSRQNLDSFQNGIFAIVGSAGSGKTIASRRICYEWYRTGNPVIFLESSITVDKLALFDLMDGIRDGYRSSFQSESPHMKPLRYLLVAENSMPVINDLVSLKNTVKAQHRPIDILVVERKNVFAPDKNKSRVDLVLELDDTISNERKEAFFNHFNKHGLLYDKHILSLHMNNEEFNSSFFALLYTSVKQTQDNLRKSIIKEYLSLDEDARRIYAIVAILQTYDQEAYLSLISRTAEISPDIIMEMIKDGDLRDLVIYEEKEDNILRVSQKLIAEIVTDEAYPSARDIKQILLKIISSITPNNVRAMNMLHSLLIKRIKDGLNIRHLQVQDKIELFKAAISNVIESRTLLHHLAILYLSDGMTKECRIYIRRALECTNLQFSEAKRNVFDTQGRLELAEARIESENGDHDAAALHFITAENFFKESQGYPMESPHSYQGQAETYFEWSKGPIDILNKEQLLVLCLSICSNYIDLTSDSLNPMFLSLRTKSLEHLRTLGFDVNGAKQVASTYKNADGFAYFAEIELDNGNTDNALRLVNEGLTYNLGSNWLNRLKIKLIKIRFPNDSKLLGKSLDEWLKNSESSSNIALKFEYAKFKYMNGEEKEALSLFQGISSPKILDIYANHPQHEIWSIGIDRKEFIGKITKVPVADEVGYVKYNSMQFKEKIMVPFSSLKFTPRRNNDVRFNVAFSLSGPYAVNIRSMS